MCINLDVSAGTDQEYNSLPSGGFARPSLEILIDDGHRLSIEQVASAAYASNFTALSKQQLQLGFNNRVVWVLEPGWV